MDIYDEIARFYAGYAGEKRVIGKSAEGRDLFALHIGGDGPQLLSQYAIHGREWITSYLALAHIRRGVPFGGAWILPLTNPDGALISRQGFSSLSEGRRERVLGMPGAQRPSLWKANANGVDLNVNFDARWGTGKYNVFHPASENYVGPAPHSEPETRALCAFTLAVRPAATLSWHTKGEEIYWDFHAPAPLRKRSKRLASVLSKSTGYPLREAKDSVGGYKDWCISALGIPAFTVETGKDAFSHPLTHTALCDLLQHSVNALWDLLAAMRRQTR